MLSSLLGGGLVTAVCTLVLLKPSKRKAELEIRRLELEIKNLGEQTVEAKNLSIQTAYAQSGASERVLFDTTARIDGFQIEARGQKEGDDDDSKKVAHRARSPFSMTPCWRLGAATSKDGIR